MAPILVLLIRDALLKSDMSNRYAIRKTIYATKTTAAQNEVALSYRRVRGLYFLAVVFVAPLEKLYVKYPSKFL